MGKISQPFRPPSLGSGRNRTLKIFPQGHRLSSGGACRSRRRKTALLVAYRVPRGPGKKMQPSTSTPCTLAQEPLLAALFARHSLDFCIQLFHIVPGPDRLGVSGRNHLAILVGQGMITLSTAGESTVVKNNHRATLWAFGRCELARLIDGASPALARLCGGSCVTGLLLPTLIFLRTLRRESP